MRRLAPLDRSIVAGDLRLALAAGILVSRRAGQAVPSYLAAVPAGAE